MNVVDLAALCLLGASIALGYRRGAKARARAWMGAVAGLVFGLVVAWSATRGREGWGGAVVAGVGLIVPMGLGYLTGRATHRDRIYSRPEPQDRILGALVTGSMMIVVLWLAAPLLAAAPAPVGDRVSESTTVEVIDALGGPIGPIDDMAMRIAGPDRKSPVAEIVDPTAGPPGRVSVPTAEILDTDARTEARLSVVGVSGIACGTLVEGTGFVIAPFLVATNAHVVAGVEEVRIDQEGGRLIGQIAAYDPATDLALIRVPELAAEPLPLATGPGREATGEVLGFAFDGEDRITPYRVAGEVTATGRDIYDEGQTRRQVLYLAAELDSGHSGAPLMSSDGVVGMVFAVAPNDDRLAFALTADEVAGMMASAPVGDHATLPVDSGPCR